MPRVQYDPQKVFGMKTASAMSKVIDAKDEIQRVIDAGLAAGVVPGTTASFVNIEMPLTPDFGLQAGQGETYWTMLSSINATLANVADSWLASLDMGG